MIERDLGKCSILAHRLGMSYGELSVLLQLYQCSCEKLEHLTNIYGNTAVQYSRYNPRLFDRICTEQGIEIKAAPEEKIHKFKGFSVHKYETDSGYNYFTVFMESGLKVGTYKSLQSACAMGRKYRNRERVLKWQ